MKVKVLRGTVIQGRARVVGEVLDITGQEMHRLGGRVEILVDDSGDSEPETATMTTATNASLVAGARTSKRK